MSQHEKDSIRDCLFSGQDMKLHNIRFARGSAETIDEVDFRGEICRAADQRRAGMKAAAWPKTTRPMVDVQDSWRPYSP